MQRLKRLTGGQLSVVLVAALLCLCLPTAVTAAGLTKVVVAGKGGKPAKVKQGRLQVGATLTGPVRAELLGRVTTQPAEPTAYHHTRRTIAGSGCVPVATAPPTEGLVIRQVRYNVHARQAPSDLDGLWIYGSAGCLGDNLLFEVSVDRLGPGVITFDPGVGLPAGSSLYATRGGGVFATVYADGYEVPKDAVGPLTVHVP